MPSPSAIQEPTVRDIEQSIAEVFDKIRESKSTLTPDQALVIVNDIRNYLVPSNLRIVVQLEEDGRKKRSTASAKSWRFETGEIVLFFEPEAAALTSPQAATPKPSPVADVVEMPAPAVPSSIETPSSAKLEVQQCCEALAHAEKEGKQFIALKWFRDLVLAGLPYAWATSPGERQRVLSAAVDSGAILLKKIPNPRSPMHPTITL